MPAHAVGGRWIPILAGAVLVTTLVPGVNRPATADQPHPPRPAETTSTDRYHPTPPSSGRTTARGSAARVLLVSQGPGGVQGTETQSETNGTATVSSHDGRLVVFATAAALVPDDTNELSDVYSATRSGAPRRS